MILDGGLILQALAGGGSSGGGKVKPITITENGTYNVSDAERLLPTAYMVLDVLLVCSSVPVCSSVAES